MSKNIYRKVYTIEVLSTEPDTAKSLDDISWAVSSGGVEGNVTCVSDTVLCEDTARSRLEELEVDPDFLLES